MNQLGAKRVCPKCGTKFYDLGKSPAECPKCKHSFNAAVLASARGAKKPRPSKPAKPLKPALLQDSEEELDLSEFETPEEISAGDDELENLDDLDSLAAGELEALPEVGEREREEDIINSDDAEDDVFIEDMEAVETLVDKPEDAEDLSDEEE